MDILSQIQQVADQHAQDEEFIDDAVPGLAMLFNYKDKCKPDDTADVRMVLFYEIVWNWAVGRVVNSLGTLDQELAVSVFRDVYPVVFFALMVGTEMAELDIGLTDEDKTRSDDLIYRMMDRLKG